MINTIIFDFGNVFINLNNAYTLNYIKHFELSEHINDVIKTNIQFEKGIISTETFISRYLNYFPNQSKDDIINKWNSILDQFPIHRLDFLKDLRKKSNYELILLSNTNLLHINWIEKNIPFYKEFKNCFDAFYLSHEINLRKPDIDIFKFVLNKHQLEASKCYFIDDNIDNINAAKSININTWHLNPKTEDVSNLFETKSNLF